MFRKFELTFWNFTISCMQQPNMRKAIQKTGALNWQSIAVTSAAILGSTLGLLTAFVVCTVL